MALEGLEATLRAERERLHVPGFVVGVRRDGSTEVVADGVADLETGEGVSAETSFRIASVTKSFTAALALEVAAEGLLDLDAPLADGASARQLLSHQAGLGWDWPAGLEAYGDDDGALLRLAADEPSRLPVRPGEVFSYANPGYWLVAAAIQRATDESFEAALQSRLLDPLGLANTGFAPATPAARGYEQVEPGADEHKPSAADVYPRVRRAAGGLWSTVGDLLRFGEYLTGRPEQYEPVARTSDGGYGLGLAVWEIGGRRVVGHPGSVTGFQSQLVLVPGEGLVLAALTNSTRGRMVVRPALAELDLLPLHERRSLTPRVLAAFAGRYRDHAFDLAVTAADGGLRVEAVATDPATGERVVYPPLQLEPIGPKEFVVVGGDDDGDVCDFPRHDLGRFAWLVVPRASG
jgi:CubicO group peptidase (beta-lactamase class C family)